MTQTRDRLGSTEKWATFASGITYEQLPNELIPILKGLTLDTIGVALAASTLGDCCPQVANLVRSNPGAPECTVLGYGDRVSCLMAGFANGGLVHSLNFDALGRAGGHIGVAAVPAPLVMAEKRGGVSGKEFLASIAAAAEFTARLAGALTAAGVDANEKFLEGQLLGFFGAAVGAGRILRCTPERMHNVLGLALMQASGTRQVSFEGGAAKAIAGAFANHGAILSVLLAEQGIDARCAALEGPAGLYSLFYDGRYRASVVTDGLGKKFHALDIVFKPWATSGILHPFIEASLQLRQQNKLDPAAIRRVQLRAGPQAKAWLEPVAERRRPRNAATAANSIFFAVAKSLLNGDVTLADFTPRGLGQPEMLALAAAIDYVLDEQVGGGAVVEVTLRDGPVLTATAGDRRSPVSFDQLVAKFRVCAGHAARAVSADAVEEFIDRVANLEAEQDVGALPALLSGRAGPAC